MNRDGQSRSPGSDVSGEPTAVDLDREPWAGLRPFRIPLVVGLAIALLSVYFAGDWRDVDVGFYRAYALGFWGALSHPLLPAEYPPLSILPFALTLAGPDKWYPDVFAFLMGLIFVLGYFAFRRFAGSRQAGAYALYLLAAGPATLLFRYDLIPALLVVGSLWLVKRQRFGAAYALIAVGTLVKLFPIVILPVAAVAHWRSGRGTTGGVRRQIIVGVGTCLAIVTAGFIVAAVVDPRDGLGALTYNFRRPTEVESVPATLLWLASLAGVRATATVGYGSFNLVDGFAGALSNFALVALAAGLLWTYWRQLRGNMTAQQAAVAALLVLLSTSKVLSAQYILWLAPLLAATVGFQMRWFFVCLLTALVFPTLFEVGVTYHGPSIAFNNVLLAGVAVRNTVLVVLTVRFLKAPGAEVTSTLNGADVRPRAPSHSRAAAADTSTR